MASSHRLDEVLVVGVDVGGTKVAAYEVVRGDDGGEETFEPGQVSASVEFPRVPGFRPLPTIDQEHQLRAAELDLAPGEREQARRWIEGTARCISAVVRARRRPAALVGIAAPGRKSPDGTGLLVVRNGPRIPDFSEQLERHLRRLGVELLAPPEPLRGDGVAGCLGEHCSRAGALHGVDVGYWVGGGTGLAEALFADGRVHALDAPSVGLPPAWRLSAEPGRVYEDLISMRAIRDRTGPRTEVAGDLVDFLVRRVEGLRGACASPIHPQRLVVGQALGAWLAEDRVGAEVGQEVSRAFRERAPGAPALVFSTHRPAPGVGAAAMAWELFRSPRG